MCFFYVIIILQGKNKKTPITYLRTTANTVFFAGMKYPESRPGDLCFIELVKKELAHAAYQRVLLFEQSDPATAVAAAAMVIVS